MPQNSFLDSKLKPRGESEPFRDFITLKARKRSSGDRKMTRPMGLA
jgi:hypothetical protein